MMAFSDPHTEGDPRSTANGETHWAGHFRAGHLSASKDPNLFLNPNLGRKGNPMTLFNQLKSRAESGNPIRVGLIGAGKFGSMFLSQAPRTPGIHLLGIADLSPARAHQSLERVGWSAERHAATSFAEALKNGTTHVQDDAEALIANEKLDVVIDATGVPAAGIRHALLAFKHRKHIVMVNVEADVLAGPLLAKRAAETG